MSMPMLVNVERRWEAWAQGQSPCTPPWSTHDLTHAISPLLSQTHFDAHLLHDDYVRTLNPKRAKLFYVPLFLAQRHTWGGSVERTMDRMLSYLKHARPFWNASGGADHVFFVFGEKLHCAMPPEISERAILLSHWGGRKGFTKFRNSPREI